MKYFIISSFINALTCSFCCLFVLLNNRRSSAARSFAFFNCTVALWSFFYFLSMLASQYDEALFYSRTLNAIALFIPPSFLYFCAKITETKSPLVKKLISGFVVADILLIPLVPTKLFIQEMTQKLFFRFWPETDILFHLSSIQFFILVPLAFILLNNKIRISTTDTQKQFKILFYCFLIAFIGGSTNYFLCFNIPIAPYGNALVSFFTIGFLFLTFKYQLMDIHVALSRSFVYTIIIFLISLFYFTVTYITEVYLKELIGYKSFMFSLLCASITAIAFIPLKDYLQKIIDKIFFRKSVEEIEQENKLLKQEITHSDRFKAIAMLASSLAHEIKNPLTVIQTFNEYLPLKQHDPEFMKKYQTMMTKETTRINNLAHDLLTFAKPSPPQMQTVNLDKIVEDLLNFIEQQCNAHNIQIQKNLTIRTAIQADANQLKQALLNIILNAIDAMPNGGILTLSTEIKEDYCQIAISDTGSGIDPKDLPHIFEPFYTKKSKGTGLGLSITQGIIQSHKGSIRVESELNKGTIFRIKL